MLRAAGSANVQMTPHEIKKRRACEACTKAKAKCSPSQTRTDICHRCERLDKECLYGESLRKRGPKTRSRMKQLEQRVETLVGMLSANGVAQNLPVSAGLSGYATTRSDITDTLERDESSLPCNTPDTPSEPSSEEFAPYDPVQAGLLEEDEAIALLDEFRQEHSNSFPFVVVETEMTAAALRREKPFLFLSIMAAVTYRTPDIQCVVAETFKEQVAVRIVQSSHKGLEMLQGLLVYSAYYHYYYKPSKQQLALMIQMSVAMAQELGLSKKCRNRDVTETAPVMSAADNRAILGTYYLAAAFAQAWRRRTTVPYTRAIARACQSFSQQPEYPSDLLIAPLIHSSELMCRINDYFSYDDIEDSEIHGETMLKLSTTNFSAELQRLRDSIPDPVKTNYTIRLVCDMLDVMVYECAIHGALWQSSAGLPTAMTNIRINMLQRLLVASQAFARTLLATPSFSLNYLAFPIWSGWFYSTLLVVKTLIVRQGGSTGFTRLNSVPDTVGDLLPREHHGSTKEKICNMTSSLEITSLRDSTTEAEELELVSLFQSFIQKTQALVPVVEHDPNTVFIKPFLMKVAILQEGLLAGIKKMMPPGRSNSTWNQQSGPEACNSHEPVAMTADEQNQQFHPGPAEYDQPFPFTLFDDSMATGIQPGQQLPVDDWLWDIVMTDANMFTL